MQKSTGNGATLLGAIAMVLFVSIPGSFYMRAAGGESISLSPFNPAAHMKRRGSGSVCAM